MSMDFTVTAEFVATANARQLNDEALGHLPEDERGASFVHLDDGVVYRVDCDGCDAKVVQAALDRHKPIWPEPEPTVADQVATLPDPTDDFAGFKAGLTRLLGVE